MQAPGLAHARVRRQPVERGERVQEGAAALWSEREVDACVPRLEPVEVQADLARGRVGVRVRVRVVVGLRLRVRVGVRAGARARARVTGRRGGATNATRAAWSGERRRSLYSVTWRVPSRWKHCACTCGAQARRHAARPRAHAASWLGLGLE